MIIKPGLSLCSDIVRDWFISLFSLWMGFTVRQKGVACVENI